MNGLILVLFSSLTLIGCVDKTDDLRNRTVIKVNDRSLTAGELSDRLASRLREFHILSARDSGIVAQAKNAIVQDFIIRVITESWAHSRQIFVRKEELEAEMSKTRSSYPDDIAFRKVLADEGLTYLEWEDRVNYSVLERLVLKDLASKVEDPSSKEISEFYNANKPMFQRPAAVRLRQIVTESEFNAERIRKELASGKKFADLAKKFSIAPEASRGGDTGWIEKGTLDVFDSAFRMAVGQRSQIVKSPYGFHIFEVIEKRAAKTLTLEEARPKITKILRERKEQDLYSSWLEEQILKARVFKDEDLLTAIQVFSRSEK